MDGVRLGHFTLILSINRVRQLCKYLDPRQYDIGSVIIRTPWPVNICVMIMGEKMDAACD